jgi:Spy/CpxP family protein refolding chaperone
MTSAIDLRLAATSASTSSVSGIYQPTHNRNHHPTKFKTHHTTHGQRWQGRILTLISAQPVAQQKTSIVVCETVPIGSCNAMQ